MKLKPPSINHNAQNAIHDSIHYSSQPSIVENFAQNNKTEPSLKNNFLGNFLRKKFKASTASKKQSNSVENKPFFDFIRKLGTQFCTSALDISMLKKLFPNASFSKSSNSFYDFHSSTESLVIDGGYKVNKLDASVKHEQTPNIEMLTLELKGEPIGVDQLKAQFPKIVLYTEVPRGEAPDESIFHSLQQPWGTIKFGYKNTTPNELSTIVIVPNKEQSTALKTAFPHNL